MNTTKTPRLWARCAAVLFLATAGGMAQKPAAKPVWGEEPVAGQTPGGVTAPGGEQQAYFAMGNSVADSLELGELKWTPEEFEAFVAGIRARYKGQVVPIDEKSAAIIEVQQKRIAELKRSRGSKDVRAGLEELRRSLKMDARPSGLAYQMLAGGSGPRPRPQDTIVFSMTARECEEGREIASMHREKVRSRVSDLMPGLAEGAQILTLGGSALFLLPGDLSFGTGEWPADVKRGVPIIVVVQLLEIVPSEN